MKELEPRDEDAEDGSSLARWGGLVAFVVLSAGVMGAVFTFGPYVLAMFGSGRRSYHHQNLWMDLLLGMDTPHAMQLRFWAGAVIGAVGAGVFWRRANRSDD